MLVTSCAVPPAESSRPSPGAPSASVVGRADISLRFEVPPVPGPVKPYRGEMTEQVFVRDGVASMYFVLRNVGEEPVTFLNTLYDYEPTQLYTPVVRLEWQAGGDAIYTRAGRFFPSPAVIQPGGQAVYVMGGQAVRGSGTPGDLITHIKYCPTRGMDDLPGIPVQVSDLAWRDAGNGLVEVSGMLVETLRSSRLHAPSIGVAFFDAAGNLVGAIVDPGSTAPLSSGERRPFTIVGKGVALERIARAEGYAVIP